jgi:hypothetical protein
MPSVAEFDLACDDVSGRGEDVLVIYTCEPFERDFLTVVGPLYIQVHPTPLNQYFR